MVKNSIFAFDETLEDEIKKGICNIKNILDYLVYKNQEGTITSDCWEKIKNSGDISNSRKGVLKGSLDIKNIDKGDTTVSTVSCLNYESQFKPIILITKKDSAQLSGASLKSVVRVKEFKEVSEEIKKDEDFFVWKASELWKFQKFKK